MVYKLISITLLTFVASLFFYQKSYALIGFGGNIIAVTPCNFGVLLVVGPPRGGVFLLAPGARIYPFFSIKPGSWTLGVYAPVGACVVGVVPVPVQGTILTIGTSI